MHSTQASRASRWISRWLAVLVTLAFAAWFVYVSDSHSAASGLNLKPHMVLMALAPLLASYCARALRLFEELSVSYRVRWLDCLRIVLLHNASVNIVPFRGGEVALPLLLARDLRIPMHRGVVTLAWLRMQDLTVVAVLALIVWPDMLWQFRVGGLAALLTAVGILMQWGRTATASPLRHERWGAALQAAVARPFRTWFWCAANWALKLAAIAVLLSDLAELDFRGAGIATLGGEAAAFLPIQGIAGFGTYEAGVVLGAKAVAASTTIDTLLRAAFSAHVLLITSALLAGLIALLIPRGIQPSAGEAR